MQAFLLASIDSAEQEVASAVVAAIAAVPTIELVVALLRNGSESAKEKAAKDPEKH